MAVGEREGTSKVSDSGERNINIKCKKYCVLRRKLKMMKETEECKEEIRKERNKGRKKRRNYQGGDKEKRKNRRKT